MRILLLLIVTVTLAAWLASPANGFTMAAFEAKVVSVADGDTLTVLRDHIPHRIRLQGIEAPEKGQPYGEKAKPFTSKLAFGQLVQVEPTDRDQYGRLVADVILPGGRSLKRELVPALLGWWYRGGRLV